MRRARTLPRHRARHVVVDDGARMAERDVMRELCEALALSLDEAILPGGADRLEDVLAELVDTAVGTLQLLEQCLTRGSPRIVFVSSGGALYGEPSRVPIREDAPTDPTIDTRIGPRVRVPDCGQRVEGGPLV